MTEYSRMAKGNYTVTGGVFGTSAPDAKFINLPFKPDYVELINYTRSETPAEKGIPFAYWDASVTVISGGNPFNPTVVNRFNATPVLTTDVVLTKGISVFDAGQLLQYGPSQPATTVTAANPIQVTSAAHGLTSGDVVVFQNLYQTAVTGMQQIAGMPFTITVVDANNFTVEWNATGGNYTAIAAGGLNGNATFKKVLYPYLYFPGTSVISAITLGATTTVSTTSAHNFVVGQEVAFRIPTIWGTQQLNSLPNTQIPGSPIYGYVVAVTDYNTFVVNINSTGFTAFNPNQAFATFKGEFFPQVVAVGDVNTGGVQISAGSALYPPPYSMQIGTAKTNTINGPAIMGAYVNNTSQGFVIGQGATKAVATAFLGGAVGDVIEWRAYLHDLSSP